MSDVADNKPWWLKSLSEPQAELARTFAKPVHSSYPRKRVSKLFSG